MLQDVNVDATLLVALQVLPAVSTFITGFVSVLVHAGLDRAREQADRLEERIEQLVDADSAAAAAQLQDLAIAHRHALQMRRSARFGDLVNTVILAFVAVLALVVYKQGRLELPRGVDLAVIPATSAALLAIVVIEAAVVVIGWLDHLHVQLELGRRAKATIWAKVAFIERSINARSDLAKARRLAHEVFLAVPAAIWPLRLRARTNLAMAARPGAAAAATVRAATTGLAEINLVITAKQSRQNRLADDLKLRAWGNVLLGNLLAAAADLQAAIGEDPSRPDLWLQLGEIQGHLGANQAAVRFVNLAATSEFPFTVLKGTLGSEPTTVVKADMAFRDATPFSIVTSGFNAYSILYNNEAVISGSDATLDLQPGSVNTVVIVRNLSGNFELINIPRCS